MGEYLFTLYGHKKQETTPCFQEIKLDLNFCSNTKWKK